MSLDSGSNSDFCFNKDLINLAKIMPTYLLSSRSDNTRKKYNYQFHKWDQFITKRGGRSIPAKDIHVALYFTYLLENKASFGTLNSAYYAIKWKNEINGHTYDAGPYVSNMLKAAKRLPKIKVSRKDPITPDIMMQLANTFKESEDLVVVRDLAIMSICYAGFLRFNEASNLKFGDLEFKEDHVKVLITKSKTDQFREGNEVLISKGETVACPVKILKKYLSLANIRKGDEFIFRPLYRNRNICKVVSVNKPLSYTRARECILTRIKSVPGTQNLNIGLHSFRAGGATQAASAGVNERCWMRHGRWATDGSKNRYVKESTNNKLSVSRSLGL